MQWRLTESSAAASVGPGGIEVFPAVPARAARLHLGPGSAVCWEFAEVRAIPQHSNVPDEIYCRGHDLICRYRQTESDLFAYQLDWQLLPAAGPFALGAELWLSIQTALLDTQPELDVSCQALGSGGWRILMHHELSDSFVSGAPDARGPAAMVCGGVAAGDQTASGVWFVEPTDQVHARLISPLSGSNLQVRLFGHFMEKGVIRRARMRFLLAAQSLSDHDIAGAYQEFAASPLPLTA